MHRAGGSARDCGARALGAIGDERAESVLIDAPNDASPEVRAAAAEAFERLPHERAIDRLRALLRDVDVVRSSAAETLHRRWVPSLDLEEDVLRALAADRFSATSDCDGRRARGRPRPRGRIRRDCDRGAARAQPAASRSTAVEGSSGGLAAGARQSAVTNRR